MKKTRRERKRPGKKMFKELPKTTFLRSTTTSDTQEAIDRSESEKTPSNAVTPSFRQLTRIKTNVSNALKNYRLMIRMSSQS